jgi:pantothenate kinase type III
MAEDAEKLGVDGVVNIRYASASVMANAAEVIVYGTAVKIKLLRKGILHCTGGASRRAVSPQHPSPEF